MGSKKKNYLITTAQANARVNKEFQESIETLQKEHNAELVVLPTIGQSANDDYEPENFPEDLEGLIEFSDKRSLNNNIALEQFNVRPYQIDPITGLDRFAQRETSLIFASPKQRWRYIPHSNKKLPKALITTGAITKPNYATGHDVSAERRRLGNIARRDHEYGAILVKVNGPEKYHWRNIIAQTNGKFCDEAKLYDGKNVEEQRPLAMVCGDWHVGYTVPEVRRATLRMIKEYKPKSILLHDFFNGHSVSHHMQKELIFQMIREGADKNNLSLEQELKDCGKELATISEAAGDAQVYVVQSNHLEFLDRYLDEARFVKDPHNARLAIKLANDYADGKNPVEEGIKKVYGKIPNNVTFLRRDSDLKVQGYQLANHGDTGPGHGRGSIISKEKDFGKSITGHVHKSEKLRQTYTVGTMIPLDVFYIRGNPVAWTHSHALVYPTGVQMMNIVNGKYK